MLSEEQAAAVGFFFPANLTHQHQLLPINPSEHPLPFHPFSADRQQKESVSAQLHTSSSSPTAARITKRQCAVHGCTRMSAEACGLCKGCCGIRGQGCTTRSHRTGPPTKVQANSFVPARPSAASLSPLSIPTPATQTESTSFTTISSSVTKAVPHLFREDMNPVWEKEWNDREQAVRERREAAELKRKNEQAMARQVVIQVWRQVCLFSHISLFIMKNKILQDGFAPIMIRHQNILTYPTLNIAQSEALMTKIGTNSGAAFEIWNPRTRSWSLEDINHSMNLKGQPQLLIRFMGVRHCPGFEHLIGEISERPPALTVDTRKHYLGTDDDERNIREARRAAASTWLDSSSQSSITSHSSPVSSSSSPFPSSPIASEVSSSNTYELEMFGTTTFSQSNSPITNSPMLIPDYDLLWAQGYVHVPNASSWPSEMYARDMAWGLTKLKESRKNLEQRFRSVFPGVPFVKATFYRQLDAFFRSTVREMDHCRALTRGAGGLWMDWRASSSGWKQVAERKKKCSDRK